MGARRLLLALTLVSAGVLPIGGPAQQACAGEAPRAALVVSTGAQDALRMCVALPDPSVTGIELVELAGEQHGLAYSLGFGGEAVCMLAGVGPTGGDCFAEKPDFWGYWRGTGSGGWTWSSIGAGSTTVEDGDVEGWSWGSGTTGDTHLEPPATKASTVCPEPEPSPPPDRDHEGTSGNGGHSSGGGEEPSSAGAAPSGGSKRNSPVTKSSPHERRAGGSAKVSSKQAKTSDERRRDKKPRDGRRESATKTVSLAGDVTSGPQGPQSAAVGSVAAAVALAAAGALVLRRRRASK